LKPNPGLTERFGHPRQGLAVDLRALIKLTEFARENIWDNAIAGMAAERRIQSGYFENERGTRRKR
jgi:hypothetical protein